MDWDKSHKPLFKIFDIKKKLDLSRLDLCFTLKTKIILKMTRNKVAEIWNIYFFSGFFMLIIRIRDI